MTNINCTKNCRFQQDGKCSYDSVTSIAISQSVNSDCPYQSEDINLVLRANTQL